MVLSTKIITIFLVFLLTANGPFPPFMFYDSEISTQKWENQAIIIPITTRWEPICDDDDDDDEDVNIVGIAKSDDGCCCCCCCCWLIVDESLFWGVRNGDDRIADVDVEVDDADESFEVRNGEERIGEFESVVVEVVDVVVDDDDVVVGVVVVSSSKLSPHH